MGQATVALPDPLPSSTAPASTAGSADDLLSQLAGEEIDKLLAEADAAPGVIPHEPVEAPEQAQIFQSLNHPPYKGSIGVIADRPSAADEPALPEPVDEPMSEPESLVRFAGATESVLTAVQSEAPTREVIVEEATTAPEMAALQATAKPEPEPSPVKLPDPDESLPLYLKPLEWVSAPLQLVPEKSRDLVGRIAIITFFNALAVLAYLFVFHRK